ncbi:S24 family peptidase [Ilumatobacter sp.]|uniref:S24 family peptidase n=1 Tax=Ilumatobacter sp. TaxID=1967498 RepID=UPI003B52059C
MKGGRRLARRAGRGAGGVAAVVARVRQRCGSAPAGRSGEVDRRARRRAVRSWCWTALGLVVIAVLGPGALTGSSRLLVVGGDSMLPTYRSGDVVVLGPVGAPSVGDVVVLEVPDGPAAGRLIIHRVVDVRADGAIVTRGDSRRTADPWRVGVEDLRGRPRLHVPRSGALLDALRRPWVLGALAGGLVSALMWPNGSRRSGDHPPGQSERRVSASDLASRP